jgi:choline dehydrogenase-like flavoprotein
VNAGGRKKVTSLLVRRPNGEFQTIRINKALIVAGGAIASSRFLMRSGLGGVHVGKGVACNYAFPSFVEFRETLDAFDGLQMSLFAAPDSHEMVFETTFNPPGSQAIMTPQYFADHERMMKAFRSSMVIVALVGSDPTGSVSQEPSILFGRAVDWAQTDAEIQRVKTALSETVRIARAAGATRVLLPTHPVLEIPIDETTDPLLDAFQRQINGKEYFRFATPHPQGGNMMADGRHPERVVEPDFRVRDCENIYVCDASIFPRGIRINPQWTIMALASRAGMLISESTT